MAPREPPTAAVRPIRANVPDEALVDLRRRVAATRWPDRETVTDRSQGVPLATLQALVHYWGTDHDWRQAEAKLKAWPQFVTTIDGLDIHCMHVRSRQPNALPLIMTHGWPGSVFELLKVIGPLTDPPASGGRAEDTFDLVLPSMPGYGFSERPQGTGWGPERIARAWDVLMSGGEPERSLTRDWLTNTGTSGARLYWENNANNLNAVDISLPGAITVFPGEIYQAPCSWAARSYHQLIYYNKVDKGGHFAAWEQPELFAAELRAAFRSLRPAH